MVAAGPGEGPRGRVLLQKAVEAIEGERWNDLTILLQDNAPALQMARLRLEQQGLSATKARVAAAACAKSRLEAPVMPKQRLEADAATASTSSSSASSFSSKMHAAMAGPLSWADNSPWSALILVQVVIIASYAPAFYYKGFVMDDAVAIERNPNVVSETFSWSMLMSTDFWGLPMHGQGWTNKSFRPLVTLSFRLNYLLHGLYSSGFHITNVLMHCIASITVGRSATLLMGLPGSWAAVCCVLFGVHPVHTENVLYLVGRADILAAIIGIAALNLYASFICPASSPLGRTGLVGKAGLPALWQEVLALSLPSALIVASGLSKESGFTLYGLPLGMELMDLLTAQSLAARRRLQIHSRLQQRSVIRMGVLGATTFMVALARYSHTSGTTLNMSPQDNPISFESSKMVRVLSYAFLHGVYAKLLFWPGFLCYDYSMDAIPLLRTPADARLLLTLATYVGAAAALTAALQAPPRHRRAALIALALLAVTFFPASNIAFPVGTVIGERLMYFPSAGSCLALVVWLHACFGQGGTRKTTAAGEVLEASKKAKAALPRSLPVCSWTSSRLVVLTLGAIAGLGTRTLLRTRVWSSSETLFIHDGHAQPTSSKTQFNLGITHMQRQEWDEAVEALIRCAWADPLSSLPFYRIGQIEILRGRFEVAEEFLAAALDKFGASLMVRDEEVFHDLAVALFQNGKHEQAERRLRIALQMNPEFDKGWNNLACCLASRDIMSAARAARKAVAIAPENPQYWANFAVLARHAGDGAAARDAWTQAKAIWPGMPEPMDCTWEFAPGG
eukprot:TRINITY_DN12375_c0_g2_i3.p1 TRINITY_DN12375_c0_g2~~TRINITY_DN12375_c0_g2_i3.p1  ORF type:complete len:792 (-),score=134.28 TRINITY_DN12375_c0_g2_i3:318-2693(-)